MFSLQKNSDAMVHQYIIPKVPLPVQPDFIETLQLMKCKNKLKKKRLFPLTSDITSERLP
jgi:hypothetical protein